MDERLNDQIRLAYDFCRARVVADGFRFWDTDRAMWYLVGAEEMAELGEMMLGRPAERLQCYQTWIEMYCEKIDPNQSNGDGYQI